MMPAMTTGMSDFMTRLGLPRQSAFSIVMTMDPNGGIEHVEGTQRDD